MRYKQGKYKHPGSRINRIIIVSISATILLIIGGLIGAKAWYYNQLKPLTSTSKQVSVEIPVGYTINQIGKLLQDKKVIKNKAAFEWYIRDNNLTNSLKAGTYLLDSSQSTAEIAKIIAGGKIDKKLFTILPGQRLDQIRSSMIKFGYDQNMVDEALNPVRYINVPILSSIPEGASLEGYLYPESFESTARTTPEDIIRESLEQMSNNLPTEIINTFDQQGLSIHQAITLASIIEMEVSSKQDRRMVAGVFYNRLKKGMPLGADATYKYAAYKLGQQPNPFVDSPYNTRKYPGLPPGPISNVSKTSIEAVAYPIKHDYLFFVSGDDGKNYFSKTVKEHEALAKEHCKVLCSTY